jgi:aquaporin Z
MTSSLLRRSLAEGIGTFFLVMIGPGAVMVDAYTGGAIGHAGVALAFGFVVLAMVYAMGPISGAHINPAVTIALWSAGKTAGRDVISYGVAQCGGAVLASFLLGAILGPVGSFGATLPAVPTWGVFALEWLISFALMVVILSFVLGDPGRSHFGGIAIGLTVGFAAMVVGPLTGASMNPARSLGPAVAGGLWEVHWIYWAAPISAMLAAVPIYRFLIEPRTGS